VSDLFSGLRVPDRDVDLRAVIDEDRPDDWAPRQVLLDAQPDPTAVVGVAGTIVLTNLAWTLHARSDPRCLPDGGNFLAPLTGSAAIKGDCAAIGAGVRSVVDGEYDQRLLELSDGKQAWLRKCQVPSGGAHCLVSYRDDSRRREHVRLRASTERFDVIFTHAPIGMALVDLVGEILRVNPAFSEMTGLEAAHIGSVQAQMIIQPDDWAAYCTMRAKLIVGELSACQYEAHIVRADGQTMVCLVSEAVVCSGEGEPAYFIVQCLDITARKAAAARLDFLALHDPLTGVANRTLFFDRLEQAIARSERTLRSTAVAFIDLDDFKSINDTAGHAAGDEVLIEVGRRLRAAVRPSDTVARLGGDEIAICFEEVGSAEALSIVERVKGHLAEPFDILGVPTIVGASIGTKVATADEAHNAEALLSAADQTMYQAKRRRRRRAIQDPNVADT